MDKLMQVMSMYRCGTKMILRWRNGIEIKGKKDTMYDTCNFVEEDKEGYKEFFACLIEVQSIKNYKDNNEIIKTSNYVEVSMENPPQRVYLEDETVIWDDD